MRENYNDSYSLNENNKYMYELHCNDGINTVGWSHGKGLVQYPSFAHAVNL